MCCRTPPLLLTPLMHSDAPPACLQMTGPALVPFTVEKQDLMMTSLQNLLITEAKVVMMKCLYVQEQASNLTSNLDNVTISVLMTQDLTGSDLSMVRLLSGGGVCSAVSKLRIQGLVRFSAHYGMVGFLPSAKTPLCGL